MPTVRFLPSDQSIEGPDGETLFELGRQLELPIDTACVGKGTCGLCRVKIIEGAEHLSPYGEIEERHLGNVYHLTRIRLACQTRINGDVVVELAPKRRRRHD